MPHYQYYVSFPFLSGRVYIHRVLRVLVCCFPFFFYLFLLLINVSYGQWWISTKNLVLRRRYCFCSAASVYWCPFTILSTSCSIARLVTREAQTRRVESHRRRLLCCLTNWLKRIRLDLGNVYDHNLSSFLVITGLYMMSNSLKKFFDEDKSS